MYITLYHLTLNPYIMKLLISIMCLAFFTITFTFAFECRDWGRWQDGKCYTADGSSAYTFYQEKVCVDVVKKVEDVEGKAILAQQVQAKQDWIQWDRDVIKQIDDQALTLQQQLIEIQNQIAINNRAKLDKQSQLDQHTVELNVLLNKKIPKIDKKDQQCSMQEKFKLMPVLVPKTWAWCDDRDLKCKKQLGR